MKDSEFLVIVREKIRNRTYTHICFAIQSVNAPQYQRMRLIAWIESMLGSNNTYLRWLLFNNYSTGGGAPYYGRLAWLDWMIAECEKNEAQVNPNSSHV